MEIYLENLNATINAVSVSFEEFVINKTSRTLSAHVVLTDANGQQYGYNVTDIQLPEHCEGNFIEKAQELIEQHFEL